MFEKSAGVALEFKDLDIHTGKIKHSVFKSIDQAQDLATQGMFKKSWEETKPSGIKLLYNHKTGEKIGTVTNVYDDAEGAYTEFKWGNWTLANDVKNMAEEGVLEGASFGYNTVKKEMVKMGGKPVRKLLEVKHIETSLLTVAPCHPDARLLSKALEQMATELKMLSSTELDVLKGVLANDMMNIQNLITLAGNLDTNSDLYGGIMYMISRRADFTSNIMDQLRWNASQVASMQATSQKLDSYLSKALISDETHISLTAQNNELKQFISSYDTAFTGNASQPGASDDGIQAELKQFIDKNILQSWLKKSQLQNN